ncbi:unnamed protein product [Hymenolepis diminuta]|uniref:Uncharacterized protein n=1 Tax=Hymenolepis diminuta TaxID=6216 RepID=A0A564XVP5_HYMDI|nr:unnamed protein product [Hymenolepis diminuta]
MDAPKEVEDGLYDLVRKSGVPIDRKTFKILLNLISMNCDPMVIYYILKHPLGQISAPNSRPAGVNVGAFPRLRDKRSSRSSSRQGS